MSPNDIDVLLHYYTKPGPHERMDAPAVQEAIRSFLKRGILQCADAPDGYSVTEKGRKLVGMICATPDPVNRWIDPREKEPEVQAWADAEIEKRKAKPIPTPCDYCGMDLPAQCVPWGKYRFCDERCKSLWLENHQPKTFGPGTRLVAPNGDEILVIGENNYFFAVNIPKHNVVRFSEGRGDFGYCIEIDDLKLALQAAGYRVKDDA